MAHRQFIQRATMDVVLCEWDARRGTWRCSATAGSPYNRRVDTLSNIVQSMKADGYEELTPSIRRVGRFSKAQARYSPLPKIDSKSPGMPLTAPVKSAHSVGLGDKHFPI